MAKRKWKHAANLAIAGGVYFICADIYLNAKDGQMTFSQAMEYAYEIHGWWVIALTASLLTLFFIHVFWRGERIVWNWVKGLFK